MKRYLVLLMRTPAFDVTLVEPHRRFLAALREDDRVELAGGFTDATGGAYLLRAASIEEAASIAHQDPLHETGASLVRIHEWNAA